MASLHIRRALRPSLGGGFWSSPCENASPFICSTSTRRCRKVRRPPPDYASLAHSSRSAAAPAAPTPLTSIISGNNARLFSSAATSSTGIPPKSYDDGIRPYQITTPIYYVNDKPHVGHAYTSIACDVLARFHRLSGRSVFFQSGTDEHGQKVEESARSRQVNPQQFVDEVSVSFRNLLDVLNISHDVFVRTTDAHHKEAVQHLWKTLEDKGYIYLGNYEGWYSVRDECYYLDSELVDGKAPTGAEVEWVVKEESYFFRLSAFEDKLLELYESQPDFVAPSSRRNEVISFVKGGLKDLSISRTSFEWGVPIPTSGKGGDADSTAEDRSKHLMYVWIDALANYLSALGYPNVDPGSNFDKYWPASLHVVGKDILRFHTVYWPAILLAADLPPPRRVFAHGWWTINGEKMSKSVGNVIDPLDLVDKYGVDQTRFFLMSEVPFGSDGDFSHEKMVYKVNANLSNEIGNLCQRTLSLVYKNCHKAAPSDIGLYTKDDEALLESAASLHAKAAEAVSTQSIHKYVEEVVSVVWEANQYIDKMEPWVLRKNDTERMGTVLYVIMEVLRRVAILYQPVIPASANKILDQLSVPEDARSFNHLEASPIRPGIPISKPKGIFPRFDVSD